MYPCISNVCTFNLTQPDSTLPYLEEKYKWHTSLFDDISKNFFPAEVPPGAFGVELRRSLFPLTLLEAGLSNGLLDAAPGSGVTPRESTVPPFESPLSESSTCL